MPSKIRILNEQTINKIAAGEVIENPASVVKELVENAIDAEAKEITVEIIGGGRSLIRVTDDGYGMTKDDAILCLERHATSKIKDVDDIATLMTMGFRGEAIPSIASISKFSILTSQREEEKGTLIIIEAGKLLQCKEVAASKGTTIEVKDLFFNVPVRRKFQKSPTYDTNEILKTLTTIALGNPFIKFELISNNKKILVCPTHTHTNPLQNLKNRMESLLGNDFADSTYEIQGELNGYQIFGFIGFPSLTRHNRTGQYLFINNRGVQNSLISYFVKEGYGTTLPPNRYPLYVLHFTIPGDFVDVNVHPQKKEVRLRAEQKIQELTSQSVEKALQHVKLPNDEVSPYKTFTFAKQAVNYLQFSQKMNDTFPKISQREEKQLDLFSTKEQPPEIQILNLIPEFILVDKNSLGMPPVDEKKEVLLCLVDQKSAYSRILYENFSKNQTIAIQSLLIPHEFKTTPFEESLMIEHLNFLNQMGLHIYQNGPNSFMLDAIPEIFDHTDTRQFVTDLILKLQELKKSDLIAQETKKRLAICASRAALSYQRRLSMDEAKHLLHRLMQCEMPYHCPKGKPIFAFITKEELQRFF